MTLANSWAPWQLSMPFTLCVCVCVCVCVYVYVCVCELYFLTVGLFPVSKDNICHVYQYVHITQKQSLYRQQGSHAE